MDKTKNTLGLKLLFFTLISLALGVGVFFLSQAAGQIVVGSLGSETTRSERLEESAQSLQDFVTENEVTQSDKEELDSWVSKERYVMLQVYSRNMVMYDSTMDVDMSVLEMAGGDAIQWQKTFTINFADGEGEAMFYEYYQMQDEFVATIVSVVLGVIAFAIALLLLVRKKTKYIMQLSNELHILEGGNLDYEITVKGKDELGDLANSINDMRVAMIERQQDEEKMRQKSYELITSMSHDLRSPLTSLIGYLDILELKKYKTEQEQESYLSKSRAKAYRIKDISDDLFEYFLSADAGEEELVLETYKWVDLLKQLVADNLLELESAGFHVEYEALPKGYTKQVRVDKNLLERAFENLFSNARKYADPKEPVCITVCASDSGIMISLSNAIRGEGAKTTGTGIGLQAAKRIFAAHDWDFAYHSDDAHFKITISANAE